ncbi:MAG TPA: hypothetical protein VE007_01140 [Thermoanaerobaculia bacterium]|nr:hypothetical protein [Thermoanaerobaculia bacterium]
MSSSRPFRPFRPAWPLLVLGVAVASVCAAQTPPAAETDPAKPLPELHSFLEAVRGNLHSDETLLDQYTFTEKHTERRLDGKGGVKKVTTETYEVYPSLEPGHTYRRLVERDGHTLTSDELAAEDRKHDKKVADAGDAAAEQKRAAKLAEARRKEESAVSQLFAVYDIQLSGRELVEGRPSIVLAFRPKAGVNPAGRAGKILAKFAGRAWIDEQDKQLVRVDAELVDTLSFGLGVLARLQKGSRASITRRKVNGEIWLPAMAHFTGSARLLLVKGLNLDATSEYSDYRKFQVATTSDFTPEPKSN